MDPYRLSEDSPSARRRAAKPCRKRLLSIFSVLFLVGVVVAVAVLINSAKNPKTASGSDATKTAKSDNATNKPSDTSAANEVVSVCVARRPGPHMRTVAFWQSEVAGCEKIPAGVTHVVFGFALVDAATGRIVPTFQNTDAEIQSCVKTLRANCIASLGSIGGATNNKAMANITDPSAFAQSAVELVTKFGFDGVDIDDETAGPAFNASRAVAVVEATRAALTAKDKSLLLTYDAYFYEGDQSWCADPVHKDYARCFPPALLSSLDWINIMAYNVAEVNATAVPIYEKALNTTFAAWKLVLNGDFTKATIGICVAGSCDFGPGPSKAVIARWNAFARVVGNGGGMMVYAASSEFGNDFSVTRSVLPRTS